ncbi:kinase-like domain-containing protein [Schizophyllum amplum]|uniref:Kinase-like domain-containing protein n=1 Tax=Schizophyllum amplum TaxID=97359 RepID=A0A550C3U6_9AGAR|nr:kinase-like domain-containing protein [Auriculariopsis ampla]
MAWRATAGVLNVAVDVATAFGCPVPSQTVESIVDACEAMVIHKRKCRQLVSRCQRLLQTLQDRQSELEGNEQLRTEVDELTNTLYSIHGKVKSWPQYNRLQLILKRHDIEASLDNWNDELDIAMQNLQLSAHIITQNQQREAQEQNQNSTSEMLQLLSACLSNQQDMQQLLLMQQSGENVAAQVMEAGQMTLAQLRERTSARRTSLSSSLSETPSSTVRQVEGLQHGLVNLHNMTGIPPYIKRLDGEVERDDSMAIAGGTYSDIWQGTWMREHRVALKSIRSVKAGDIKAQNRFKSQIELWAQLRNENILQFYGIVTDLGPHIYIVTPLQENGNVLDHVKRNPSVSKQDLLVSAARGVAYLHSRREPIVHGNLKCTNILVNASGQACISDFGMAKVVASVTGEPASTTLTAGPGARWLAPELINCEVKWPTTECDVYSFAMTVLELLTEKKPFCEQKRDYAVIKDVIVGAKRPERPQNHEQVTDGMWALLQKCWVRDPEQRPRMAEVLGALEGGYVEG